MVLTLESLILIIRIPVEKIVFLKTTVVGACVGGRVGKFVGEFVGDLVGGLGL